MPTFVNMLMPLLYVRRRDTWQHVRLGSLGTPMWYRPQPARFVGVGSGYLAVRVYEGVDVVVAVALPPEQVRGMQATPVSDKKVGVPTRPRSEGRYP